MDNNKSASVRIGFTGLLQLVFIVLKLCGVIKWSWMWVLSPIWTGVALVVVCLVVLFVIHKHEV